MASNFRSDGRLEEYLAKHGVVGIAGIDTRALVRRIREHGALKGVLSTDRPRRRQPGGQGPGQPGLVGRDLVREVVPKTARRLERAAQHLVEAPDPAAEANATGDSSRHVVALDYGMKWNIARHLCDQGCRVTVLPGTATSGEVLAIKPDGVFLSNGPGDPEPLEYAIDTIRELLGKTPVFGICLGHQLLSLACGAKTFKLKFGHRGANQPVQNLDTGRVEITSQNHGFAVAKTTCPTAWK